MAKIKRVFAREILDSRGNPTVEVDVQLEGGAIGQLQVIRGGFTFPLSNPANVRLIAELGGGGIWDVGCYPISYIRCRRR